MFSLNSLHKIVSLVLEVTVFYSQIYSYTQKYINEYEQHLSIKDQGTYIHVYCTYDSSSVCIVKFYICIILTYTE